MWRKLIEARRNRRFPKPTPLPLPTHPPTNQISRADSPSVLTRSPSFPHPSSPRAIESPPPSRSRTDIGTSNDPSTRPIQRPVAVPMEPIRRRLSLDGTLPAATVRPDSVADDDLSEGLFEVYPALCAPALIDVSACSRAGWEPVRNQLTSVPPLHSVEVRKENQDAFCVFAPFRSAPTAQQVGPLQIFLGVFDGHGAEGRPIAHYARDFIASMSREAADNLGVVVGGNASGASIEAADTHLARLDTFKAAFSRAERGLTENGTGIDHVFSGTTAVVAWFFGRELYTAWTGDSRCVVGKTLPSENGRPRFRAVDLSHDQKPVRPDEKRRVRNAGGRIARWQRNMGPLRVWLPKDWTPGLAMTRSIGDTVLSEYGVSPVPEVTYTTLGPEDSFLVLASDGVWEFMTSQEVVDFIGRMRREGKSASDASEALVREAVRRWRRNEVVVDDTTAVVMWMSWTDEEENTEGEVRENGETKNRRGDMSIRRSRRVFSKAKAKVSMKSASMGVHLVGDDGSLTDFVCKNDSLQGA